ncbi:MAG TPA: hypothetical protein VGF13_20575 [Verrucomicrobiae bacterium]|jgi:hypothetical protein
MKKPGLLLRMIALGGTALLAGCETCKNSTLTGKLWHWHELTHFREPAIQPQLAVYYAPAFDDFLVAYDSTRDDESANQRLNYFVRASERNVADHKSPALISTNGLSLVTVPVNGARNVLPYATFDALLTIYTQEERLGPYPLPNYKEAEGTAIKTALTPVAVLGDATVVGLVLGMVGLVGLCQSGVSFAVH